MATLVCEKHIYVENNRFTTYGILRGCEWSDIPYANEEKAFECLQEIGLINIKKIPGNNSSNPTTIQQAYFDNKELLKLQIETYNPTVMLFGNTLNYFYKSDFEGLDKADKGDIEYGNTYYSTGKKLYIHSWHPTVRGTGFSDERYCMDIVDIVRNWKR